MEFRVRIDERDDVARQLLDALVARGEVRRFDEPAGRVLVVGGARSGKSSWAEACFADREIDYVATSFLDPTDPEWAERIRLHRERRPSSWRTLETMDVAGVLRDDGPPVLVDCLAVWITRILDDVGAWEERPGWREGLVAATDDLVAAVSGTRRECILVSNEVGSGVVPAHASGRLFRDELGRLNARVAAAADQLWHVTAGVPVRLR